MVGMRQGCVSRHSGRGAEVEGQRDEAHEQLDAEGRCEKAFEVVEGNLRAEDGRERGVEEQGSMVPPYLLRPLHPGTLCNTTRQ